MENEIPVPATKAIVVPDENSQTAYIVAKIKEYAEKNGYEVTTNKSTSTDVPHVQTFSKHASSQPDLLVQKSGAGLFVSVEDEDCLNGQMEAMSLSGEGKLGTKKQPNDPWGQMLGNMEKALGDIVYRSVSSKGKLVDKITLFGLYFLPECNKCTVYRAVFKWNTPTEIVKVKTSMEIKDAVNRIFHEMSKLYAS